jgi:hypothetical protein
MPCAAGCPDRPPPFVTDAVHRHTTMAPPPYPLPAEERSMKYMMFVCTDTEPDEDRTDDIDGWVASVDGRRLDGSPLAPPSLATTVRVRGGQLLVSDGPFAETKEVIVGYDILECEHLDEAIEIARAHPMARIGRLELRPIVDFDGEPRD